MFHVYFLQKKVSKDFEMYVILIQDGFLLEFAYKVMRVAHLVIYGVRVVRNILIQNMVLDFWDHDDDFRVI